MGVCDFENTEGRHSGVVCSGIPDIAVVVLSYNNFTDTEECVSSLVGSRRLLTFLIDNSSTDGSAERLRNRFSGNNSVRFVEAKINGGYAAGNNLGIRHALETEGIRYVCILNNDTVAEPGELEKLAHHLDVHPECGVAGPVILEYGADKIIQSAGANISLWRGDTSPFHRGARRESLKSDSDCPYVGGACMMFRSTDIGKLGYIPECYFLFFEETEWCLRATRNGAGVTCVANAAIAHKGSATVSAYSELTSYLLVRNRALFERRNASRLQIATFLLYFSCRCVLRNFLKGRRCLWEFSATRDGLRGTIDPRYSNIYLG